MADYKSPVYVCVYVYAMLYVRTFLINATCWKNDLGRSFQLRDLITSFCHAKTQQKTYCQAVNLGSDDYPNIRNFLGLIYVL